jgi:glucose/arabinose dehydrogenase
LHIYKGSIFPERKDNILIGMLKWQWLLRIQIDPKNPDNVIDKEIIIDDQFGRVRYVTEWPDGSIYISTSNMDGRGNIQDGDDKIIRIYKK